MRTVACSLFVVLGLAVGACGDSTHRTVDAAPDTPTDAPIDAPGGSALAQTGMDPSPKDHALEIGVIAISTVVAAGPIGVRRRRRRTREL